MAEIDQIKFSHTEVATALVKQHGLHEGRWMLAIEFGINGVNVGPDDDNMNPAAVVPILKISLSRTDKVSNLSVDAAEVNPKPK